MKRPRSSARKTRNEDESRSSLKDFGSIYEWFRKLSSIERVKSIKRANQPSYKFFFAEKDNREVSSTCEIIKKVILKLK